ncbi:MAG: hypothetical protein Q9M97_06395 [Candidatus Gracilibacteria bacterium]|nr:hypothetical protein [Candidatus Gracilibacteria bacterium]
MEQVGIKKDDILENILIEKLVFGGKGFARLKHENPDYDGRVIFVTGGAIPGTVANLRVLKKKKAFLETQIVDIIKKSDIEIEHPTNKYGMSGGWKWINIPYNEQLKIKEMQVKEALQIVEQKQPELPYLPIVGSPTIDGYRNKVEFSFGKFLSKNMILKNILILVFTNKENFQKFKIWKVAH